ncbi:MAG: hypothetical protein IKB79_05025 [Oscillospiraceae bacterium]|nr:hypothetical protein [Oscillospiraceae bacterium]
MIRFDNWTIQADGDILARQFDHLTRTLCVEGDIPAGWEWAMLVQVGAAMDIIPLTAAEDALSAVLTAQQLSVSGYYNMQLRGTKDELVRHTNTVNVYIPASLSGDKQWPEIPSEFTEMERRVTEKAAQAEGYATHPPIVGDNSNWWEWDGTAYADTGKSSRGEQGIQGEQGSQGIPGELTVRQGNTLYANALKGTASGSVVYLDDVSPLEHSVPVKVRSKNLVDADKMLNSNLTKDENGVYRITKRSAKAYMFDTPIPANTPIVLTYENLDGYNANSDALFSHSVYFADETVASGNWVGVSANFGNSLRINASKPITGFLLVTYNPSDDFYATFTGVQLEIGTTATAYTPYVPDLTAVTLTKTGLNIWDEQWELGTIYNSGNAAGATDTIRSKNFIPVKAGVKLRFTLPQMARVIYYDTNKTAYNSAYPSSGSTLTPSQDGYIRFAIGASVGTGNPAITEYGNNICISVFDEATKGVYEPYKGENYVPSEDGTCEVVSVAPIMTLLTDTPGVVIDCEYNRDINKAFEQLTQAIISMGGNI